MKDDFLIFIVGFILAILAMMVIGFVLYVLGFNPILTRISMLITGAYCFCKFVETY